MNLKNKIKMLVILFLSLILLGNSRLTVLADSIVNNEENELFESYNQLIEDARQNNISLNLEFSTFKEEYNNLDYTDPSAYSDLYYQLLIPEMQQVQRSRASLSGKWYYNTGTSLPQAANYAEYNLLNTLMPGDIIYEAKGGFGITGHIAIVEGKFYDDVQKQYYIRIVEAINYGVVRSVLDDQRVIDKEVQVLRVKDTSASQQIAALNFCTSQLGKKFILDFAKDTSADEKDWYCSELVWAGYMSQGFNIEATNVMNEPGITPRDIKNSNAVVSIDFK